MAMVWSPPRYGYLVLCSISTKLQQDRRVAFMLAIQEWRHIKMCKRAGRGHNLSGIEGTAQGGLSVLCRACPLPGINLPDDWQNVSPEFRYVFSSFILHY